MNENLAFIYGVCVGVVATAIFAAICVAVAAWRRRRASDLAWEDGQ